MSGKLSCSGRDDEKLTHAGSRDGHIHRVGRGHCVLAVCMRAGLHSHRRCSSRFADLAGLRAGRLCTAIRWRFLACGHSILIIAKLLYEWQGLTGHLRKGTPREQGKKATHMPVCRLPDSLRYDSRFACTVLLLVSLMGGWQLSCSDTLIEGRAEGTSYNRNFL